LLALLPVIYVAWSDGDLTLDEWRLIAERVEKLEWLDASKLSLLDRWVNPDAPPAPGELRNLLNVIRQLGEGLPESTRESLADLGAEMARVGGGGDEDYWNAPEIRGALTDIENALGLDTSAFRELLEPGAAFDVEVLSRLLGGHYRETRKAVTDILRDSKFRYKYGLDRATYEARVHGWLKDIARHGFGSLGYPPQYGGKGDIGRFFAIFEALGYHDLSLAIKFGVQFGLFGGSINQLGTERHREKYLRDVGTLALPGSYAMTEVGHGSNVRDIETTARYDASTHEFVIHTPSDSACKVFVGNAARYARIATVFARLQIGDEDHGIHAFLVPLRDIDEKLVRGVSIEDVGEKLGLNGVDNGIISFDHVKIPRGNLLNRYADVGEDGTYTASHPTAELGYFNMLSTLMGGRVGVAAVSVSAVKSGLTIATRYGSRRRQFRPPGEPEVLILDYRTHQRRLMPPLATAYALDFAVKHLVRTYLAHRGEMNREVDVLAAGIKTYSTWFAVETLQTCREACGGVGYLAVNRFAALRADADVLTTIDGDNTMLMQLVAKERLTEYRRQLDGAQLLGALKSITNRATRAITELNPIVTRIADESHLRDSEFQLGAFRYREEQHLISLARRLKKRIDLGIDSFTAFNQVQDHMMSLANAYVERVILEQFIETIDDCPEPDVGTMLETLCDLFALSRIEADQGWFLESGYIERSKARAIRRMVNSLCAEVRQQAIPLVDAFAIPDELIGAPIGRSAS
jgi:acyl-CoA oxidase